MFALILHFEILDFAFTGTVQHVSLDPGTYVLECWGAQGGHVTPAGIAVKYQSLGSKAGYSRGSLVLHKKTSVYIYVGGKGGDMGIDDATTTALQGGWNGGGSGQSRYFETSQQLVMKYYPRPGGGATDISFTDSEIRRKPSNHALYRVDQ